MPDSPAEDAFMLVAPPAGVGSFQMPAAGDEGHWINYADHPAYREILQLVTVAERLRATGIFIQYFLVVAFKRLIAYELIPAHLRKAPGISKILNYLKFGLARRLGTGSRRILPGNGRKDMSSPIYMALQDQGICVIGPKEQAFNKVSDLVKPAVEELRHRRGEKRQGGRAFIESRATVLRTENLQLFDAVESLFRDCGVLDAVSAYTGRRVRVVDINPQVNDQTDDFWRRAFPDMENYRTDTAYFHRDASGGDVKAIIYLSDVTPENGPFTFVLGI